MKLTVTDYRPSPVGLEYAGFQATLHIDDTPAARVWNDGNGGPNAYQWIGPYTGHTGFQPPADVQAWLATLPPVTHYGYEIQRDLDCMVEEALPL